MYEQFMGDFTFRDSASRQVRFIFISFVNFRATTLLNLVYFSTYSDIKKSLPYPNYMLRAHYISTSLATVKCGECSLNQFSTSLFVSLFVHREPQQITGRKYRMQGQFGKSQGNCSNHFASHILSLSVWAIINIRRLGGVYWTFKTFTGINITEVIINKFPTVILYLVVLY